MIRLELLLDLAAQRGAADARGPRGPAARRPPSLPWLANVSAHVVNFWQISENFRSFSAVSKRIFATKYAFDSIFQNPPDYLAEIFEIWQFLQIFKLILQHLHNFC